MTEERKIYNLIKDKPDPRDFLFKSSTTITPRTLPPQYDLRTTRFIPPILDQGTLGSCGPNQISNSLRFCLRRSRTNDFQPSRLFIYYFARLVDGLPLDQDTGISIRGGLKAVQKYGTCNENNWPYNITQFKNKPNDTAVASALRHRPNFRYERITQNLLNLKQALFQGFPIICGIQIYSSFESPTVKRTGIAPIPNTKTEAHLGGHCVAIIGYDDNRRLFTLANTWGNWGNQGYFVLPYDYILNPNLTSDFWIVTFFQ